MNVKQKLTSEENIEWTLADLIDFEILLDEDTKTDYTELSERDGDIRRELITGLSDAECNALQQDTPENRRRWLHQWLQVRKKQTDAGKKNIDKYVTLGHNTCLKGAKRISRHFCPSHFCARQLPGSTNEWSSHEHKCQDRPGSAVNDGRGRFPGDRRDRRQGQANLFPDDLRWRRLVG